MPSRQPRWPSIGLASLSACVRSRTFSIGDAQLRRGLLHRLLVVGQELVQRRIEQADRHRPPAHLAEDARRSPRAASAGSSRAPPAAPRASRRGSSRAPRRCASPRRTCARCGRGRSPPRRRAARSRASFGVSALARTPRRRRSSAHSRIRVNARVTAESSGLIVPSSRTWRTSEGRVGSLPRMTSPAVPSIEIQSPSAAFRLPERTSPCAMVDRDLARADDAGLAHAARDDRRVRGRSPARREDPGRRVHAGDVLGRGLLAHENDGLALRRHRDGRPAPSARSRPQAAPGPAGRPLPSSRPSLTAAAFSFVGKIGASSCTSCSGSTRATASSGVDQTLVDHVGRDAHGREARPLAVARLEQVELALLDRELEVLHVAEALLEAPRARAGARRRPSASSPRATGRSRRRSAAAACGCPRRRPRPARSAGTRRRTSSRPSPGRA